MSTPNQEEIDQQTKGIINGLRDAIRIVDQLVLYKKKYGSRYEDLLNRAIVNINAVIEIVDPSDDEK